MKEKSLPPFQSVFPPAELIARRTRVAEAIGRSAKAVIQGGASTGAFDVFRQSNEMYYLTGVEVPHAYLCIDGKTGSSTLYLPPRDEKLEKSDGPQLNCDDQSSARFLTGVDQVHPLKDLSADIQGCSSLFTPMSPAEGKLACRDTLLYAKKLQAADPWELQGSREEIFKARLCKMCPGVEISDLSPILDRCRLQKSFLEIQVMRKAGRITAQAISEAMRNTRAGMYEYQIAAIADFVFQVNGSRPGGAYRPIAASGKNIWNGHYFQNSDKLKDGDWILLDFAPDYFNYTSDIGRYWPVNGVYSKEQRELYGYIVEYHKTLLKLIKPGLTAGQIMDEAASIMRSIVDKTKWSNVAFESAARKTLEFRGHLSHSVGMAVHDVGDYTKEPLKPGTVFAVDPQMWVPDLEIYVRVEDTVLVTEDGVEVLTREAPLELNAVEDWMANTGSRTLIDVFCNK